MQGGAYRYSVETTIRASCAAGAAQSWRRTTSDYFRSTSTCDCALKTESRSAGLAMLESKATNNPMNVNLPKRQVLNLIDQRIWIRNLKAEGYRCDVLCDSVAQVVERIEWYLEG
jgi:hypothetical protein